VIIALSLIAETPVDSCTAAMARRDAAMRPIVAELAAKRIPPQQLAHEWDRHPPLREAPRFAALHDRLAMIDRDYPYRDCKTEQSDADR